MSAAAVAELPRVVFLGHLREGPLRLRAEAFRQHLAGRMAVTVLWKDAFPGGPVQRAWRAGWAAVVARPRAVLIFDVGTATVFWLVLLRLLCRARLVLDVGDHYHELHRRTGFSTGAGLAARGWVERVALALADGVVARGQGLAEGLAAEGHAPDAFIPDGVDVDALGGPPDASLRTALGFDGALTVALVGTLHIDRRYRRTYGWDLLEALALLPGRPVKALIVGDGPGLDWLEARARELGVRDRLVLTGRLDFPALVRHLRAADVCVSTQSDDVVGRSRTTGKLPLYMALGRFVLASRVGEAARVLPDEMLLDYRGEDDPAYPARLARRIDWLLEDRGRLAAGRELVARARARYDYAALATRLAAVLVG